MKRISKALPGLALALSGLAAQAAYVARFIEDSKAWGTAIADFNGDGHDDIFITGHDTDDRIWYWTPSGYVPAEDSFVWVDRHDCDAADINHDNRIDLYCSVGAERGHGVGPNEVWLQDAEGAFHPMTGHGAEDAYGRGRYVLFFDLNHDGYPDLYVTNQATPRADSHPNYNRVFVNQAGTGFVEAVTRATGRRGYRSVAKGDINQDGWDDLVVCDFAGQGHLYLNNQAGDFTELQSPALAGNWRDAKLVDVNHDGREDLVVITSLNEVQVWLNKGAGAYFTAPVFSSNPGPAAKWLAIGDFNADGRKDIYVVLQGSGCPNTLHDTADDVVYEGRPGPTWEMVQLVQGYDGCGHMATTLDGDKVLLMNGGVDWHGPNYLIRWTP